MRQRVLACIALSLALASTAAATGCGSSAANRGKTVLVAYQVDAGQDQFGELMHKVVPVFEKEHPGWKVQLDPINAQENEYYTKLDLMNKSPSTQPDALVEDTFLINSDADAHFLAPLDGYTKSWSDWKDFYPAAKAGVTATNGHVYGIPLDTDTRGLWYNKQDFAKAGLPVPWHPKSWADVLAAARKIKAKVPGVTPMEVFSGTPAGEAASMQGFEMLLYGTGESLYDHATNKWIKPGKGFTSALNFIKTVYGTGLGPSPQQELNPNIQNEVWQQWLPQNKLAIDLDGSWLSQTWLPSGPRPWPQWSKTLGWTPMPTETGQGSPLTHGTDTTTLSGGWAFSMGADSQHKQMTWDLMKLALDTQNNTYYTKITDAVAVRSDVAKQPSYLHESPDISFWTSLVKDTNFRPAYSAYPGLSNDIQQATEGVMTGQESPQQAASTYGQALTSAVGPGSVEGG
ncbi:MAG: extracellular solute-binding protein [Nocardiopsaceae bacterium]|nr:extracellular solute-binding protein [Nocardiopsaceae bacterium]